MRTIVPIGIPLVSLITCIVSGGVANAQQEAASTTSNPALVGTSPSTPVTTAAIVTNDSQNSLDLPAPDQTTSPINRPLMVASLVLLVGTYGASAIEAAVSSRDADKNNLVFPVVGPWMDYANRGCDAMHPCTNEAGNKALLILDGVGQGLGALGILTSLFIPEKTSRHWYVIGKSGFDAGPTRVGTGYGLAAVGVF